MALVPLYTTMVYIVLGMIAVGWLLSQPGGTMYFSSVLHQDEIPEEFHTVIITVLAIIMVIVWPALFIEYHNRFK